ncbi:beta-N-acetylhexosaminidase [Pararcticibacter amylolyticus]|uniref:beta-N-acetylhexosaminidase n=1 Tax=Pararcticibacter amylolyticus TaxID=2173175 RepID=A0A2U2PFD2_9SPHI|nr:beta-N-acetylhexosaminidase [Pararcticibacter amylolyticus]PWG80115.1 beta-N-acetylhexosaminidase [Pararcticibacter amylolyticus]
MKKNTLFVILMQTFFFSGFAQVSIIPKPVNMVMADGGQSLTINAKTPVTVAEAALQSSADFLNDYLVQYYGFLLKSRVEKSGAVGVHLSIKKDGNQTSGSYSLSVDKKGVRIRGNDAAGVFYGVQTLIQLLPSAKSTSLSVPFVTVNDAPRFSYRGMHLDVARHFFPVSFVKKYIDYLALHKFNYFHWHLTDDQGWRIEIKKYPKLTQVGGYRNGTVIGHFPGTGNDNKRYGGFYTQEEVKEIVNYAAKRYITVVPEIEMPGHASAAIAAYPELSCFPNESTKFPPKTVWAGDTTRKHVQQTWGVFEDVFVPTEKTFAFLQDVIDEVVNLFPSKYIHIGGDECPKDNWKRSEFCQQLMKEKGLKDEHELQSYFIQRMEKYINNKGRTIIGWDEILEGGLAPNAMVMSWRGEEGGIAAAKQSHYVIMTPGSHVYFDHSQVKQDDSLTIGGYTTVRKVYSYEPVPRQLSAAESKYVMGAQANVWSEYMEYPSKVEYQVFPRMSALSEVLWSPKQTRDWNDFEPRLREQLKRYDLWKAHYGPVVTEM